METDDQKQKDAGWVLIRAAILALAAACLMFAQALIDKETGVPGGNFSYLTCVLIVVTIWLVAVAKRPIHSLRS